MNQMKIAVGTASDQKIGYLEEILKELEIDYSLKPFPVSSGVRDQPLSNQETKTGSINRARNALSQSIDSDFAIGIEVGYHPATVLFAFPSKSFLLVDSLNLDEPPLLFS